MDFLKYLEIFVKPSLYVSMGLVIFTSLVLFLNESFIETMGLLNYKNEYKANFGIIFLLSSSMLLSLLIITIVKKYNEERRFKKNRKIQIEYLNELTYEELTYLKPYIVAGVNTQYFVISDGVMGGLVQKGILYRSADHGDMIHGFPYNIQPWAMKQLNKLNIDFNQIGTRNKTPFEKYIDF